MGRSASGAARAGTLVLLLLLPAVLAGAGLRPAAPVAALAIVPGDASDDVDDPDGLIVAHPAKPALAQQPVLGELTPQLSPVPSGPLTYVPILYYHYIRVNPNPGDRVGFGLSTPPTVFRAQMQYLADQGFHVISLHQAVVAVKSHGGLPTRPVVLTFDDGYGSGSDPPQSRLHRHGFRRDRSDGR